MGKVYISYHKEYNHDTATFKDWIDIRDYVDKYEWVTWLPPRGISVMVSALNIGEQTQRTNVFAQRLLNAGHQVYFRNKRGEEWISFQDKRFNEDDMRKIEEEG